MTLPEFLLARITEDKATRTNEQPPSAKWILPKRETSAA